MTRLEYERRRRRWNQTELAFHSRLTQSEISQIERRRLIPSPTYAERLGRALGLAPSGLLDEVASERTAAQEIERVAQ
ncbi:MAG: helix-turn-helix domain-containing protein [Vicinamibacteria bacterium]